MALEKLKNVSQCLLTAGIRVAGMKKIAIRKRDLFACIRDGIQRRLRNDAKIDRQHQIEICASELLQYQGGT